MFTTWAPTSAWTSGFQQTTSAHALHRGMQFPQVVTRPSRLSRTARAHASGDAWNRPPTRRIETQRSCPRSCPRRLRRDGTLTRSTLDHGKSKPGESFVVPFQPHRFIALSLASSRAFGTDRSSHRLAAGTSPRTHSRTGKAKMSLDMDARWTSSQAPSTEKTRAASCGCATGVSSTWPTARHGRCIWCDTVPAPLGDAY